MVEAVAWGMSRPSLLTSICIEAIRRRIARGSFKRPLRNLLRARKSSADIIVDGLRMRCYVGDNYTENALVEGKAQDYLANAALIARDLREGDVFVDIGANCGLYSLYAARKVGHSGKVVAIEPIPEIARRARFNAKANAFDQISIRENALGAVDATITLNVNEQQFGRSCMATTCVGRPIDVAMTTLLSVAASESVNRIDALKIDVEGYEDQVLIPFFLNAPPSLWPGRIFIEHAQSSRWSLDVIEYMQTIGYQTVWRSKMDTLLQITPQ